MTFSSKLALLATFTATHALTAQTDASWSRFRGPNGTGVATTTGLPNEIGPDTNVVWKTPLPPGQSSPILTENHVFVTAYEGTKLLAICLDRATGKIEWSREAPRARVSKVDRRNSAASPSAAADGDTVVVFFNDFGLIAYDHEGKERWKLPLGPFNNVYGMGASPVISGTRVFLCCDQQTGSFVIAADKKTGKELWRTDRPYATSGHSTPVLYRSDEGTEQLIVAGSFFLDGYDTTTGNRVWWVEGLSFEMKSVPVLHAGTVYINGYGSPLNQPGNQITLPAFAEVLEQRDADKSGSITKQEMPRSRASAFFDVADLDSDGALGARDWRYLRAALASKNGLLAIKAGGKGDMTKQSVRWSYHRSVPQLPSPLLYRGILYVLADQGGLVTTFDPATGKVLKRGRLEKAMDNYYASPVAADGKVWFVSVSGIVSVTKADKDFTSIAVNELDESCHATPAIADSRIYLRTNETLYCFGTE